MASSPATNPPHPTLILVTIVPTHYSSLASSAASNCLCVFCVGPLCGPHLRWWVLCGVLPSVWVPCGRGPPLSCSRFPWHLFLVLPLAFAHALAVDPPHPTLFLTDCSLQLRSHPTPACVSQIADAAASRGGPTEDAGGVAGRALAALTTQPSPRLQLRPHPTQPCS